MMQYNLYELDGYALIEKAYGTGKTLAADRPLDSIIDFSTRERKQLAGIDSRGFYYRILKGVEVHYDNALFYQVKKVISELNSLDNTSEEWNEYSLQKSLVYIDFSGVFPVQKFCTRKYGKDYSYTDRDAALQQIRAFFEKGFHILFPNQKEPSHFVAFEKSASMARNSAMIFIDKRLYKAVKERLYLGLSFTRNEREYNDSPQISASKLYAYTALYLSDAKRVLENEDFILNEETVIVIPDNVQTSEETETIEGGVITGIRNPVKVTSAGIEVNPGEYSNDTLYDRWNVEKINEVEIDRNFFDGEGIISPAYLDLINKKLQRTYGQNGNAASVQIRMPFTKGMLHSVDFHKFFCEYLGLSSCDNIYIEDAYGIRRNLGKAQIVLTQSMFKIYKWLKNKKISGFADETDCMKLYFHRFHYYDHALYIGNTDVNMARVAKIKLNYQFLNTLKLSEDDMDSIVNEHLSEIRSSTFTISKTVETMNLELIDSLDGNGADGESISLQNTKEHSTGSETWSTVLEQKPVFALDRRVQNMLRGKEYALYKDIGRGKLIVGGANRFLSRDLVPFLSYMIEKIDSERSAIPEQIINNTRKQLTQKMLWTTKFFVADSVPNNKYFKGRTGRLHLNSKSYYGILRNPHLSRNEQSSLGAYIPKEDDLYSRYFAHLKGIVMIPYKSDVPQTLGGADFDGDIVKIVTDERINRAINSACYEEKGKLDHVRKLPLIIIPSTEPKVIVLEDDTTDFRTLLDTFSSRVGQLSNCAIALGKKEYDDYNYSPEYDLKCETCTILTGLEIDAAKTGSHPYLEDILGLVKGKDYYVACKEEIEELPNKHQILITGEKKVSNSGCENIDTEWDTLTAIRKYSTRTGKVLLHAKGDCSNKLDKLPFVFLKELLRSAENPEKTDSTEQDLKTLAKPIFFEFEKDAGWRKHLNEKKRKQVEEIMVCYKQIMDVSRRVYQTQEQLRTSNYLGCINTILKFQYYNQNKILELQEKMSRELINCIGTYEKAEEILRRLVKDLKWPFFETKIEKLEYLYSKEMLGNHHTMSSDVEDALTNYNYNGYFLLYYFIKDIIMYYRETMTDVQIEAEENSEIISNSEIYKEFRDIYEDALSEKESHKIWKAKIVAVCRKKLSGIFDGHMNEALKYVYSLRNKNLNFMWDIFTANEILERGERTQIC